MSHGQATRYMRCGHPAILGADTRMGSSFLVVLGCFFFEEHHGTPV